MRAWNKSLKTLRQKYNEYSTKMPRIRKTRVM